MMYGDQCRVWLAFLLVGFAGNQRLSAQSPAPHVPTADDVVTLREAFPAAVSPDGITVLYVVQHFDLTGPAKREWHTINRAGTNDQKLTVPDAFNPVGFMPDGASLFGTYRIGGSRSIAIVPLADLVGRAKGDSVRPSRILSISADMHTPVISPDGKRFAVFVDPQPKDTLAGVHTIVENGQTALYVLGVDGSDGAWWCPSLDHVSQAAWTPDGSRLAVVSGTAHIGHHDVRSTIDLCSREGVKRVADIGAPTSGLAWTDAGRTLVFASTSTDVLTPDHVWTVSIDGGQPVDRTPRLDGSAVDVTGDPHGNVWVQMHKGVVVEIDRFYNNQLTPAYRWPDGIVAGLPRFSPYPQGMVEPTLVFIVGDPTHADNVAVSRGSQLIKITHEGDDAMSHFALGDVRVVNWTASDGTHLEGILTFPAGYRSGTKAPFLVLPHGGPEGNDPLEFDMFSRFVAGQGYVVMQPQYRGSTGYGSEFLNAIYQHFGDRAYSDVNSATDYAVAQGWADSTHLAIFGWSAGGFMTAWTVTQTHRYRAAIEGAGITDWLSFIPTSDIAQVDYDARLQEKDPTPFLKFSAVMYADHVTTPLLILHGAADERVPTFQGREFYVLLAERGKTVRMVTYPGSPHFPVLAEQRRDVFREVAAWLQKYDPAPVTN